MFITYACAFLFTSSNAPMSSAAPPTSATHTLRRERAIQQRRKDPPHAVVKYVYQISGDLDRAARLPAAAPAGQGDEARVRDPLFDFLDLRFAPDETRQGRCAPLASRATTIGRG
jgi:hypothetical protein